MDFKNSSVVTQMVNDWAESVAEFQGSSHRDCDTVFLGFYREIDRDGEEYFTAIYKADGYLIGVWWDGEWIVEDLPKAMLPNII